MESYLDFLGLPVPADRLGDGLMVRAVRRLFLREQPDPLCVTTGFEVDELGFCVARC